MTLPILVAHEQWQEFDNAWRELMTSDEAVDELLVALRIAGDKKRLSRCMALAREHAQLLEESERHGDAARILGALLVAGGNPSELAGDLMRLAHSAWGEESWWPAYTELTGLSTDAPDLRKPWRAFQRAMAFEPEILVYHPGGWGVGEVLAVRPEELEVEVRFWNGRRDTFPMNAAVDIFEPLKPRDLRSQHYHDPEGLRKRAKKEPLDVLRTIVQGHHGTATTALIRNALMQLGIEGSAWTAWWRKARKQAETSEWFDVSGSHQKAVIKLLLTAKDPSESLKRQLGQTGTLSDVLTRVRELFIGEKVEDRVKEVGLDFLAERAADESEPIVDRVAAWLLLREQRKETPPGLTEALTAAKEAETPTDPSVAPELWKLFQALPTVRDQERAVEVLQELYGDTWADEAARHLPHAAPGMVRPLVDALKQAKRKNELLEHYIGLLARPLRAPALLVTLARLFETGDIQGDVPKPVQRAHALLSLASHLCEERRGNAHLTRVHQRLVDLLTAPPKPLLRTILKDTSLGDLRSLQTVLHRGIDDAIDHMITDISLEKDRHFFAGEIGPFWDSDAIWTTKQGLERRSGELRELREVKIPQNQEAIGRAASYGDLSENSEWEAAIEEQRTLTSRAQAMEEELRRADLIENAALPEDTISPGTLVRYRDLATGEENSIRILGPWDNFVGEDVVSYKAPLAAGLLGLHTGDRASLTLPRGTELEIQVLEITPVQEV